jgi:hypothetical protein
MPEISCITSIRECCGHCLPRIRQCDSFFRLRVHRGPAQSAYRIDAAGMNFMTWYWDGVIESVTSDNMKQDVIKTNRYELAFNDIVLQWS